VIPSVLITGSRGFIGSHLRERLNGIGWEVLEWLEDIRLITSFDKRVDIVFHLAARTKSSDFKRDLSEAFDTNISGTHAVLTYCKRSGATCIFLSTSAIYSMTDRLIDESSKLKPSNIYGISKFTCENLCRQFGEYMEVPTVVLRLFNVYGEGQDSSFLVSYVIECLTAGKRIQLRMPEAERDFIYVEDVVEVLLKVGKMKYLGFEIFNIGSGVSTRVIDFVRLAEKIFCKEADIDTSTIKTTERHKVIADVRKAKNKLDWNIKYNLESGLQAMKKKMDRFLLENSVS
jgi:nucleoside-diphosphate-sugar epimerase